VRLLLGEQRKPNTTSLPISFSLIAALMVLSLTCNLLAGEGIDQEWVVSFEEQRQNNYIWDGKQAKSIEKLKEEFGELTEFQRIYGLDADIFATNGYYYTVANLKISAPELYIKLIEFEEKKDLLKSRDDHELSSSQRAAIENEIRQLQASLPPTINYENYLWHRYCRGLEEDMKDGLIISQSDCSTCKGTGKMPCKLCRGKGKVGFYNPSIDVIDPDSRTRKIYRKQELDKKRKSLGFERGTESQRNTPRDPIPGMPDSMLSEIDYFSTDRPTRDEILREKEEEKAMKQAEIERMRKENEQIECAICRGCGWCACPECVLEKKPHYADSAKIKYLPRWSNLKSKKWL